MRILKVDISLPRRSDIRYPKLRENPPFADIYICGSDQVWNALALPPSLLPIYFLDFGGDCKRISYAASFGGLCASDIPDHTMKEIAFYLKRFDAISVRENQGIDICKKAGRDDAVCVIDPTLLLSQTDYMEISKSMDLPDRKYLLLYLLGNKTPVNIKAIHRFADENNLDIVYVASQGRVDRYPKVYPTIEQWLFLLKNAEYVVTNSFHGTVFSMIMNRKFYTLLLSGEWEKMNDRIHTLLERYDLKNRCGNFSPSVLKEEIHYENINEKLRGDRKEVETWIQGCLTSMRTK